MEAAAPPRPPPAPAASASSPCKIQHCICCWRKECSTAVPAVVPAREYLCIPADEAVDSPAWSVLVGVMEISQICSRDHSLRLHRFRVARSGRVLGRSDDVLDIFADDVEYKPKDFMPGGFRLAAATQSPELLSLNLLSLEHDVRVDAEPTLPRPLQLHLDLDTRQVTASSLPHLSHLASHMPTCLVSAAGELWAPYLTNYQDPCDLVMQLLDKNTDAWVEVARFTSPLTTGNRTSIRGYAVVDDHILVSFFPCHLFFIFDCVTNEWAPVHTRKVANHQYISIHDRSLYIKEDGTIYFLSRGSLYAYKLSRRNNNHFMEPPTEVDRIFPSRNHKGRSMLTRLGNGGRVMCAVWISGGHTSTNCGCDTRHVIITTFRVHGDRSGGHQFVPNGGVDVLHSTCRRLDTPDKSQPSFCILQEYEEFNHENVMAPSMLLNVPASSDAVAPSPSKVLACCRKFFNGTPFKQGAFLSQAVALQPSAIQTKKALYIVCQNASCSTVYKIGILDGRFTCQDKILKPHRTLNTFMCNEDQEDIHMTRPLRWYFVCDDKDIYAVSCAGNEVYACSLCQGRYISLWLSPIQRSIGAEFHLVLRIGATTLALSDNLQYLYQLSDHCKWVLRETSVPPPYLGRKVTLSGYVIFDDTSFMVVDTELGCCFVFDLQDNKWSIVEAACPESVFLCERSLFAEGFIYSCSDVGLVAYEFTKQGDSYYLGAGIDLVFAWETYWRWDRMCLEYIGKDTSSGAIMFCAVQGEAIYRPGYPDNLQLLRSTTVQVETKGMANGKQLKPKTIGHVDISTFSVEWDQNVLWTRNCFAARPF